MTHLLRKSALALAAASLALVQTGCEDIGGDVSGGDPASETALPNDGSAPTAVSDQGSPIPGNFICSHSMSAADPTMVVGTNGLVGGLLTDLLNGLGLDIVAALLNSVAEPELATDGNLDTFAGVTLTAGLLGPLLTSVDLSAVIKGGGTVPAGSFAVAGLSFPAGIANVTLFNALTVSTSLRDVPQETVTLNQSALSLLGVNGSSVAKAWVGFRAKNAYDTMTVSVVPGLLTVNVGNAVRVHEYCYRGKFVIPAAE